MEVHHAELAQVQYARAYIYGLVIYDLLLIHLYHVEPVAEFGVFEVQLTEPLDGFLVCRRKFQLHSVLHVLHGLAKYSVVHQFEEVLLKVVLGSLPFVCVKVDILL